MSKIGVGIWRFLSDSEWSQSTFFLFICWSQSLVSNFKIETKNDANVKYDFDVTTLVPKL